MDQVVFSHVVEGLEARPRAGVGAARQPVPGVVTSEGVEGLVGGSSASSSVLNWSKAASCLSMRVRLAAWSPLHPAHSIRLPTSQWDDSTALSMTMPSSRPTLDITEAGAGTRGAWPAACGYCPFWTWVLGAFIGYLSGGGPAAYPCREMENEDPSGGLPWFEEFEWSQINADAWQEGVLAQPQQAGQGVGVPAQPHHAGLAMGVPAQGDWVGMDDFQTALAILRYALLNRIYPFNTQSRG